MDLLIEEHIIMQGNGQMCSDNYSVCCYFPIYILALGCIIF